MSARAAIYARYSSDLQDGRSIADQRALCRAIAERSGYRIVAAFEDRAISGTAIDNRPGFQALLRLARAGEIDVILAEHIDRITRDEADWHTLKRALDYAGVKVHVASGLIGRVEGSVLALVAATQSEAIALHTRRGMQGVIRAGRSAGGRAYGYRPVKGEPGQLAIVDAEAAVIRRIFADFIAGASPRAIAGALNTEQVPPPRGAYWRASTILGSRRRGHGILLNPLYAGRLVWNRVRMVKHPVTRRRLIRINPESEWQAAEVPQLRIVAAEEFAAAQARRLARTTAPRARRAPIRSMLSGLLRCGSCGAGMASRGRDRKGKRVYCAQWQQAHACRNSRGYYLADIERAVLEGFKQKLGSRAAIAHFVRCYNDERRHAGAQATSQRTKRERALAEAQRILDRAIKDRIEGRLTDEEADRELPARRAMRDQARAALAACDEPPKLVTVHPAAIDDYLKSLDRLAALIGEDLAAGDTTIADALRQLIDRVTVIPAPAGTAPTIAVHGRLETLLDLPPFVQGSLSPGQRVAGGRLGLFPATESLEFSFMRLAG